MSRTTMAWRLQALLTTVVWFSVLACAGSDPDGADPCQRNPSQCVPDGGGNPGPDVTPPTLTDSSQSATQVLVQRPVTFRVKAHDEESPQLRFSWTANVGTLGSPSHTGTSSEVIWTSPSCVPTGTVATVTVTVANSGDASVSKTFTVDANACPKPTVVAGGSHTVALRGDGTVWGWGSNGNGQLGDGTTTDRAVPVQVAGLTEVTALGSGSSHALALRRDGTVWTWGFNGDGQLGDGTVPVRVPVKSLLP
ncbi:hypothetical protein COCOR_02899 [Corallococcus coralloides DSM 2259]|uniref:RCC1 repeat-containing protein n=1 Tax=Corallococcus coralloides (strain ATCC 25202 / DSM 2259 / NBRC 100086 / M2) TaxID=1144275 RepID=H8MYP0_CORCM|nr:hypothetical protein COCOR_02899 [Corallococcus coralloides DSM 2259]